MPMKLLTSDDFRSAAKDGQRPEGTVFRFATTEAETVAGAARTKRFTFSDATVDHSNDSIDPKGWQLDIFKSNPVALFAHMSWDPPIGRAANVSVEGDKLKGDIEFATAEVYPFADTIYRLVDGGFLKAVSVGFIPKEWSFSSDKDRPYGIDFKKQALLEISLCPVPCNPAALGEARSLGVDTRPLAEWAERVLDNGDTVFMPRKELETLRGQAKDAAAPRFYIQTRETVSPEVAERIREAVKRWTRDSDETLILPPGFELRTVGEPLAAVTDVVDPELKSGRRISAANKAMLEEAMGHHEAATKCIKDVLGSDDGDPEPDDAPDDDVDDNPGTLTPEPPGSVVLESDDHLTPEQRRLKEARALKASLPTND